jgi:hypothetical protein
MGVGYDMNDFLKYVDAALPPKEARQFRKAIEHPMREFHKRVIAPQFFQPTQNLYLGVALDKFARGKNHCVAQAMLDHDNLWQTATSPIRWKSPASDHRGWQRNMGLSEGSCRIGEILCHDLRV